MFLDLSKTGITCSNPDGRLHSVFSTSLALTRTVEGDRHRKIMSTVKLHAHTVFGSCQCVQMPTANSLVGIAGRCHVNVTVFQPSSRDFRCLYTVFQKRKLEAFKFEKCIRFGRKTGREETTRRT
jgi:hypothetical protein